MSKGPCDYDGPFPPSRFKETPAKFWPRAKPISGPLSLRSISFISLGKRSIAWREYAVEYVYHRYVVKNTDVKFDMDFVRSQLNISKFEAFLIETAIAEYIAVGNRASDFFYDVRE